MFSRTIFLLVFIATVISFVYCEIYRLPKNVKPIRYHLTMEPHLRDTDLRASIPYEGSVLMELQALESASNITYHQVRLEIDNSTITIVSSKGEDVKISATSSNDKAQLYTIQLENELVKGDTYTLNIGNFTGKLGRGEGFFKAVYTVEEKPRGLAATHFEPTGARRAFPCFDEPTFKAKFIVSLIRKQNYTSVSNENLEKTEDLGDGRFKDTFKETPLMSTFTLAFAVTDFKYSEKVERHRILARPEAIENGEYKYSLEIANRTLIALEEYTGIDFVIDKMDQIAIPKGYFYESAMENWGLVVYDEPHLMRNNKSTAEDYQRTTCYMAHEFAHQWFGNLVTPAWWGYLWIAESFAAYFQYYIANIVQPTWRLDDQFVIDVVHGALRKEVYKRPYPLNVDIQYSGQYPPFHIMYEKGSSILRMMEHFLTHDVFRRGLQIYLKNNKFANTVPLDLYAAFQEAVDKAGINTLLDNKSVAEIMSTWDSNKGYPTVTVTRDYKTGSVTLEQKSRFDNSTKWIVPINYVFSADTADFTNTTADYWLTEEKATIDHDFPTDGWLIINKQQTSYYRINYDLENWERIIDTLKSDNFKSIHVLNRAQLINDAFNLAANRKLPWEIPLRLGEYIVRETDYIALSPFYEALTETVYIFDYVGRGYNPPEQKEFRFFGNYTLMNDISTENRTEFDVYKQYIQTTLGGIKDSLGFEDKPDDTHVDKIHRSKFTQFAKYF